MAETMTESNNIQSLCRLHRLVRGACSIFHVIVFRYLQEHRTLECCAQNSNSARLKRKYNYNLHQKQHHALCIFCTFIHKLSLQKIKMDYTNIFRK